VGTEYFMLELGAFLVSLFDSRFDRYDRSDLASYYYIAAEQRDANEQAQTSTTTTG